MKKYNNNRFNWEKKDTERKRKSRLEESDDQKQVRRKVNADRNSRYRASLTPKKKKIIQENNADQTRKYR